MDGGGKSNMFHKFSLICSLLVVFIWVSGAHSSQGADDNATSPSPAATSQGNPSISVAENVYDFGEAAEGGEVVHDYIVKNTGQAPLEINQVRPG